ncbi:MAG: 3,4-dihydroxy-2-butanone-4-phosphate synthase, partial [Myxococcota bacterium]
MVVGHGRGAFLTICGQRSEPAAISSLVRHGSGLVFAALEPKRLGKLQIPTMPTDHDSRCPDVHVAVDASSGISAADRARTIRALAAATSIPTDFVRPGHVVPVHARLSP